MHKGDGKRIAKNTLFLYIRMLVSVVVSLFTVRVIWEVLGVDNYGIFNVVGGVVLMFQFINNAMVASSQRFISFELGRGNIERLRGVFSTSLITHILLALVILFVAETIGLWFVSTQLNIPPDKTSAAFWVYQCSVAALMVTTLSVPYNSCIVAHEHLMAFGYFGILEVILKLAIVYMLIILPGDKLIVYAILVLAVSIVMRTIYGIYCKRHFEECVFTKKRERGLLSEMFAFAGWSFIGNFGFSVREQGLNVLLNIFFNVAVNAAKGIATQVNTVLNGFTSSFQTALAPQITKLYASGNTDEMMKIVEKGGKFSFFLLLLIVVPLYACCPYVLELWIKNVAPYTVGFLRLLLIVALIDVFVNPIVTALQATGKIRNFQIIICLIMVSSLPLAWIWLKFNLDPMVAIYATLITSIIGLYARIKLMHDLIDFDYKRLLSAFFSRTLIIAVTLIPGAYLLYDLRPPGFGWLITFCTICIFITLTAIYLLGLNKDERKWITAFVHNKLRKHT